MGAVDRRVQTWVDFTADLVAQPRAAFPHRLLSARLHEEFGSQVSWNWLDPDAGAGFVLHVPIPDWPSPELERDLNGLLAQHPLLRWYGVAGDMAAMSIGRLPESVVTDQGRALVRDVLDPIEQEQQMSIPYRHGPDHHRAFILARGRSDFSDEDLAVARHLQPLLRLLDRQCAVLQRALPGCGTTAVLSGRELAVLRLLADGLTAYSIGQRLGISPRTVHRHLQNLYRKLEVSDRVRAVVVAHESGLLVEMPGSPGMVVGDRVPLV